MNWLQQRLNILLAFVLAVGLIASFDIWLCDSAESSFSNSPATKEMAFVLLILVSIKVLIEIMKAVIAKDRDDEES